MNVRPKRFRVPVTSIIVAASFLLSLVAADQSVGSIESVSAPAPLIALPYDEPFRIEPPQIIPTLGVMEATTANIIVNYTPPGPGFWYDSHGDICTAWPADARAAFDYAVSIWATQISSSVPIVIEACWASTFTGNILGHGGATGNYYGNMGMPSSSTFYPIALINAVRGNDLMNGAEAEIAVAFNMNYSWYHGTNGNTPAGKIDFVSVVLHEIGHGLGFLGTMRISSGLGSWGWGHSRPGVYDRFTENGAGQSLINTDFFPNSSASLAAQLTGGSVYFDGPNANAANTANSQGPVRLYAPASWSPGSSYAHLDYDTFRNTENALMVYAIPSQTARHSPGPVMLCLLKDIGWTVPATCDTIALSSAAHFLTYSGGSGAVNIINGRCCDWTAVSNDASWLHVISSASGKGNGSVGFSVDANPAATERTGSITIAGQLFTVTQSGNMPPVAGFDFSPLTAGSAPHNVSFTDTSVNATSWTWDFDDGATSSTRNPFHTYLEAGTYTVTLTINAGADSVSHNITVSGSACLNPVARLLLTNVSDSSLLNAYGRMVNDLDTLQVQAVEQAGPFNFSGPLSIRLEGGYDCEYSVHRLYTVLKGDVSIGGNGSVIMDNLIIQ